MLLENIKKLRKKKSLLQDRLTKLADGTHTTLVKIDSGANDNPIIKTFLKKIANTLKISPDGLTGK